MKRYSKQREMIREALQNLDHPTAPEIYEFIRQNYPNISLGTVYRNLNLMADDKEILRLTFPVDSDRFDHNPSAHYHGICDLCGKILDIHSELPKEALETIDNIVKEETGIRIKSREMVFHGTCPKCSRRKKPQSVH